MCIKFIQNLFRTRSQTLQIVQDVSSDGVSTTVNRLGQFRNIIGFWILGVTNFYSFQILLSAAHDLLSKEFLHPTAPNNSQNMYSALNTNESFNNLSHKGECNALSTGTILLAEIVPQICMKFILPFYYISPTVGIVLIAFMLTGSLLLIGFSSAIWMTFLSVVGVAVSTSIGEVVLIRYSSIVYGKREMIAWAAGTGGGAIFSSVIYASLTTAGLSIRTTLRIMVAIPALMLIVYWCILVRPKNPLNNVLKLTSTKTGASMPSYDSIQPVSQTNLPIKLTKHVSFKGKMNKIKMLMPYTLPLTMVYFGEYFINLGLYELIYFPGIWLKQSEQYRWFISDYQIAVFISRSLGTMVSFRNHWILPILQILNVGIFLAEVFFRFIPSVWIMLILIFYEGLLGGASFVNIIGKLIDKITPSELEFALSVVIIGDSLGVGIAGCLALPVHDFICNLQK